MRKPRRTDREIEPEYCLDLLAKCQYGVLSTVDDEGQPYGVPLNYACKNNRIYFHCALTGHKLDNIGNNPKVSFCVVGKINVRPAEFATEYESAIVFGTASEVRGTERHDALLWLLEKYSPDFIREGEGYINKKNRAVKVVKIEIEHMSGKSSPAK